MKPNKITKITQQSFVVDFNIFIIIIIILILKLSFWSNLICFTFGEAFIKLEDFLFASNFRYLNSITFITKNISLWWIDKSSVSSSCFRMWVVSSAKQKQKLAHIISQQKILSRISISWSLSFYVEIEFKFRCSLLFSQFKWMKLTKLLID